MKTVSPIELLVPGRIDLIAKYTYIENYVKHYDVKWFNNLYKAHIEAFSGGNYTEPTNPAKNSIIEYCTTDIKDIGVIIDNVAFLNKMKIEIYAPE